MSFELSAQKALYDTLKANVPLMSLVSDIYDNPPQDGTAFPYVTIGEAVHNEWDTDTELGNEVSVVIHVWSRERGRRETKEIQDAIYNALHRANFSVSGYNLITCDFVSSESFTDSDGLTRHGVQNFRMLIDNA